MKGSQAGFSVLLAFTLLTLWLYIPCGIRYSMILSSQIRADHERRHRQAVEIHEEDSVGLT